MLQLKAKLTYSVTNRSRPEVGRQLQAVVRSSRQAERGRGRLPRGRRRRIRAQRPPDRTDWKDRCTRKLTVVRQNSS